jgi:hypothetical protein
MFFVEKIRDFLKVAIQIVIDGEYKDVRGDKLNHGLVTTNNAQYMLHEGELYSYEDILMFAGGGGTQDYIIKTAITPGLWVNWGYEVETNEGPITFEFFEGTDKNGTTVQTSCNRNRNSTNVTSLLVCKGTTGGTSDGTRLEASRVGSKNTASSATGIHEMILKVDTRYLIRITNNHNLANNVNMVMYWYEHDLNAL